MAATAPIRVSRSDHPLECLRDALAAADAQRHDPAPEAITLHRVQQSRRRDCARGTDRVAMRDRAPARWRTAGTGPRPEKAGSTAPSDSAVVPGRLYSSWATGLTLCDP